MKMNLAKAFLPLSLFCLFFSGLSAQEYSRYHPPVLQAGVELLNPFAGGLDAPQFNTIDLNGDDLVDLLIFDRVGNVIIPFIRDNEDPLEFKVAFEYVPFFPEVQLWMHLIDFNGDGVKDIFASTSSPGIQGVDVYRGSESEGVFTFNKMEFDQGQFDLIYIFNNGNYTPLYAAWGDISVFEDIDGDGDIDILVFEPGGQFVHYFKNYSLEMGLGLDTLVYEWEDICWGKFLENEFNEEVKLSTNPNQCATPGEAPGLQLRHAGSSLAVFDKDNDGDFELYLGDLASNHIVELTNGGTAENAHIVSQNIRFPEGDQFVDMFVFPAPYFIDINGDGLKDFIAAANSPTFSENHNVAWYYENVGTQDSASFSLRKKDLLVDQMLDFGSTARPCFIDINGDGLLDILVDTERKYNESECSLTGNRNPRLVLLLNTGTAQEPAFEVVDEDYLNFSIYCDIPTWGFAPAAGDLDGDGDIDLVVGEQNGALFYLENIAGEGAPVAFADVVYPYEDIQVGIASTPFLIDINGDQLIDLVVGERTGNNGPEGRCSNLNYFQNIGAPLAPAFEGDPTVEPNTACMGNVLFNTQAALREYSAPAIIRTEDGLQLIIGSEQGGIRQYSDISGQIYGDFELVDERIGAIRDGFRTAPALADLDGDGFFEMLVGNLRGGLTFYKTPFQAMKTSIADPGEKEKEIRLYPNPAGRTVWIDMPQFQGKFALRIYHASGHVVFSKQGVEERFHVDISHLTPGMYFVEAMNEEGAYFTRLVKH